MKTMTTQNWSGELEQSQNCGELEQSQNCSQDSKGRTINGRIWSRKT
jgi:hypothetical protein